MTVRIDGVAPIPAECDGDVWLHRFSVRDVGTGRWRDLCTSPSPDGTLAGFPLAGDWTGDGRHLRGSAGFTVTSSAGAIGKWEHFGYKPRREAAGKPRWDYHQTRVCMVRANYAGEGVGHTRHGTLIDLFDRVKAALRQFDRLDPRTSRSRPVEHHPAHSDLGFGTLACRPTARPLPACEHQLGQFICQLRIVPERELLERPPVRITASGRCRPLSSSPGVLYKAVLRLYTVFVNLSIIKLAPRCKPIPTDALARMSLTTRLLARNSHRNSSASRHGTFMSRS